MLRLLVFGAVNWVAHVVFARAAPARPSEIADAFWEFIAFGASTTAHRARPDDVRGARSAALDALGAG